MVVEAGENRIAVSDATNAQIAKFFFKANNNVEGTIYYALVDTAYKMARILCVKLVLMKTTNI